MGVVGEFGGLAPLARALGEGLGVRDGEGLALLRHRWFNVEWWQCGFVAGEDAAIVR